MSSTTPANHEAFRRLAWVLGLAGLLPFFAHALFAWVAPAVESGGLLRSQAHYAAAILSFLGALHWGVALASPLPFTTRDGVRLVWSVIPALLAWVITMYPPGLAIPVLFFALLVAYAADVDPLCRRCGAALVPRASCRAHGGGRAVRRRHLAGNGDAAGGGLSG